MADPGFEQIAVLLRRAQTDDENVRAKSSRRYLPSSRQIVALRLDRRSSDLSEIDDVVRETSLDACSTFAAFETCSAGSRLDWPTLSAATMRPMQAMGRG